MDVKTLIDKASEVTGSQNKLAVALGTTSGRISDWRTGRAHCPNEKIARMAQIAGLDPKATLGEVIWRSLGKLATTSLRGVGLIGVAISLTFGARDAAAAGVGRVSTDYDV